MHRTALRTLAVLAIAFAPASIASALNSVFLDLSRIDDFASPSAQFLMGVNVNLDLAGVTGVTVQAGSLSLPFAEFPFGSGAWEVNETPFTDLAALRNAINGIWTVTIVGTSPSTSTFTVSAAILVDSDFFPTATNLSPADAAINVSTTPLLSWTDPTGAATPFALNVRAASDTVEQEVLSIPGVQEDIPITATSWQPPVALLNGPIEFSVLYADAATSTVISALQVTTGAITWGNDAFSPPGYPAATPLLVLASESIVQFTVPEPSAAFLGAAALATLLARRHACSAPRARLSTR